MKLIVQIKKRIMSIVFLILAFLWIGPLLIVIMTAMKRTEEYISKSPLSLPESIIPLFANMKAAWQLSGLGPSFENSLFYAILGASIAIFLASLAGYALTKLKIKGSFTIFMFIYAGTIFPFQLYLIPLYKMYNIFNIYDTKIGMLIFYITICIPFCLFVMRNYFTTIPNEVIEAARIDGASTFRIYRSILMPMCISPVLTLFLFQSTWIWNDLLFGLMLSKSDNVRPVMPSLMLLSGTFGIGSEPQIMAGALLASLFPLLIFLSLQRYFMAGLKLTTAGE